MTDDSRAGGGEGPKGRAAGAPEAEPSGLTVGTTVGRYRIEAELGQGGMGAVYRARDLELQRDVAVKVIAGEATEEDRARLRREARAASALSHPNAATLFDVGDYEGRPFIVMELVDGYSLREMVGSEDRRKSVSLLLQVARGLAAAHEKGLVHRDVKPENVMVRSDGVAKLLDFGIAKVSEAPIDPSAPTERDNESDKKLTWTGAVMGSPAYMAPEQVRGTGVDARTDQFGWAVTAFEVLSGELPWKNRRSAFEIAASILHEDPLLLADLQPEVPDAVCVVVHRALQKDPKHRFESMTELAEALMDARDASAPAVSARTLVAVQDTRPARPTPWMPIVLGGVIALGGGVLLINLLRNEPMTEPPPKKRAPILGLNDEATKREEAELIAEVARERAAVSAQPSASASAASKASAVPGVLRCPEKQATASACTKDNKSWCDSSGKEVVCCKPGLVATEKGRCECAPGGVTVQELVESGCARADTDAFTKKVGELVQGRLPWLQGCYNTALARNPKTKGKVSLALEVAPNGAPYAVRIANSTAPDASFQDCLAEVVQALQLPPPPDGSMSVTYPLSFELDKPE